MEKTALKIPRDRLLIREILTALTALILLCWLSLLVPAPLSVPGGAGIPAETSVQAPWIFMGLQALLHWLPPLWGGVALPLAGLIFLALLPWERSLQTSPRVSAILFVLLLIFTIVLTIYGLMK
jgi:hypothetical protein